jgi:hypothetical protein
MTTDDFMGDFDFGFKFADSEEITSPAEQEVKEERIDTIEQKLDVLLSQLQNGIQTSANADDLDIYRGMIEEKVKQKLEQVERLTLPLLYNLKKNPDKEYIYWPDRVEKIDAQIQKILSITRGE